MTIKNEELQDKPFHPIIANYDLELQALWRQKLESIPSDVLCENANDAKQVRVYNGKDNGKGDKA